MSAEKPSLEVTFADDECGSETKIAFRSSPAQTRRPKRLHFPVERLQGYYHLPLKAAATELGICEAALKRICRRNQIKKWPYRQLQSVLRRMEEETRLDAVQLAFSQGFLTTDHSSDGFLLPHELESRRKTSEALFAQLAREQELRMIRVEKLKKEFQMVMATAHLPEVHGAYCPNHAGVHDEAEDEEESSSSILMMEPINVEDPLEMLAGLCVLELSRGKTKTKLPVVDDAKSCRVPLDDNDVVSPKIPPCTTAPAPQKA